MCQGTSPSWNVAIQSFWSDGREITQTRFLWLVVLADLTRYKETKTQNARSIRLLDNYIRQQLPGTPQVSSSFLKFAPVPHNLLYDISYILQPQQYSTQCHLGTQSPGLHSANLSSIETARCPHRQHGILLSSLSYPTDAA
jgi:hypothetical protein